MNDFIAPRPYLRSRSKRGAFSLLEVAFALVIFVIGAIALLRIFPTGLGVLEDSGNRRVASQMSQNLLTSYTAGDLAGTTPDAIYDWDKASGVWRDYPLSVTGLSREKGTLPADSDDFTSAKDSLKHISGEKQGVFGNAVYTNNIGDGPVVFYREGTVSDVAIAPSGQLDFYRAHYLVSNRASLDANLTKADFRQPFLDEAEGAPVSNGLITLQRGTAPITYTIVWPFRQANNFGDVASVTTRTVGPATTTAAGDTASAITANGNNLTCTVTVPATNNQANQYFTFTFGANDDASLRRATFVCKIIGPQGGTDPSAPSALLPIRAPRQLRANSIYYVSSTWAGGTAGAYDQPMVLPDIYQQADYSTLANTVAVVPSKIAYTGSVADPLLLAPLRFRQRLGVTNATRSGAPVQIPVTTTVLDADNQPSTTSLTRVSLDYDVRDWEYISEDISQFGTPFPGDPQQINTATPEGLSEVQFQYTTPAQSPTPPPMTRGELREIRTRLGNLRGPVQIKGLYNRSAQSLDVTFNPRQQPQGVGTLTAEQQKAYYQQMNSLAKQGRLYLPAKVGTADLSRARVYYRSRDAWAQQVGVTSPHYNLLVPGLVGNANFPREPWREYVRGTDGYLYFHASEAGKTVEYLYDASATPSISNASPATLDISPNILFVSALPAGVPASFTTTKFTNPNNTNDPRNGKFYLARSRDRAAGAIFDVRRPANTSGISVRTLWLNNERYAQEVAQ